MPSVRPSPAIAQLAAEAIHGHAFLHAKQSQNALAAWFHCLEPQQMELAAGNLVETIGEPVL